MDEISPLSASPLRTYHLALLQLVQSFLLFGGLLRSLLSLELGWGDEVR